MLLLAGANSVQTNFLQWAKGFAQKSAERVSENELLAPGLARASRVRNTAGRVPTAVCIAAHAGH